MNSLNKITKFTLKTLKNQKLSKLLSRQSQKSIYLASLNNKISFQFSDKYSDQTMNNLKEQATQWYEDSVKEESNVVYVEGNEQWKTEVMESKVPVILDCYADWCEPCKKLEPILVEKAKALGSKCKLVKLNIDTNPQIATALQVKSIPSIFFVHGQNALDGFVGFPDEKTLVKFFDTVNRVCGMKDEESEIQSQVALAQTFIENNQNLTEAKTILTKVLENEKWKNKFGALSYSLLSLSSVLEGDSQSYKKYLSEINTHFSDEAQSEEIKAILEESEKKLVELQESSSNHPFIKECESALEQDPLNHQVRYELAEYQFNNQINEEAIDNCLFIVKKNRNWEDKKAQSLLLSVFESLGSTSELTIKGRQKLQRILF